MEKGNPRTNGAGASLSIGPDAKTSSTPPPRRATLTMFRDPRHTICLRRVEGLYGVTVEPEHPVHQPRYFPTYREARGYAGGLRMINRWDLIDETANRSDRRD